MQPRRIRLYVAVILLLLSTLAAAEDSEQEEETVPEEQQPVDIVPDTPNPEVVEPECNADEQAQMIHCFIQLLDEWAWNLLSIKQNLASMNCTIYNEMKQCISAASGCTLKDAVVVTSALTELLLYNRQSGTFLHSVLALDPACNEQGQSVIHKNAACLQFYNEGLLVLNTVDVLQDSFLELNSSAPKPQSEDAGENAGDTAYVATSMDQNSIKACQQLRDKAKEMKEEAEKKCNSAEVGKLICDSIVSPFKEIFHGLLVDCSVDEICRVDTETGTPPPPNSDPEGQNGNKRSANLHPLLFTAAAIWSIVVSTASRFVALP